MSIPSHFGRYQVVAHLATGGMAQVFLARLQGPGSFQRTVAIKRVLPHLAEDRRFVEMFFDEARVSAVIQHPSVAEVHDLVSEGEHYLVMEFVSGESVRRVIGTLARRGKYIPWEFVAYAGACAAGGLHAAHTLRVGSRQTPVIHRDVSPQNILIGYDGAVKVIDFGVAKMNQEGERTLVGEVKGKYAYMSPEQVLDEPLDPRTDVFSLGIVLWEMLTGRRLFHRDQDHATVQALLNEPVASPGELLPHLPTDLCDAVVRCLERDPDKRFQTADALRRELERVLSEHSTGDPKSELRKMMQTEFIDRIEAKEALLHEEVTGSVPSLSRVGTEVSVVDTRISTGGSVSSPSRKPWLIAALATLAIALAVAYWAVVVRPGSAAPDRQATLPIPHRATLDVRSTPAGADAFLDGTYLGITPFSTEVDEGAGELTLRLDGYETVQVNVTLVAGETVNVVPVLVPVEENELVEAEEVSNDSATAMAEEPDPARRARPRRRAEPSTMEVEAPAAPAPSMAASPSEPSLRPMTDFE